MSAGDYGPQIAPGSEHQKKQSCRGPERIVPVISFVRESVTAEDEYTAE